MIYLKRPRGLQRDPSFPMSEEDFKKRDELSRAIDRRVAYLLGNACVPPCEFVEHDRGTWVQGYSKKVLIRRLGDHSKIGTVDVHISYEGKTILFNDVIVHYDDEFDSLALPTNMYHIKMPDLQVTVKALE